MTRKQLNIVEFILRVLFIFCVLNAIRGIVTVWSASTVYCDTYKEATQHKAI